MVSGRLHVRIADGSEGELGEQEMFEIPPGHDAWVVGDEPWVAIDFRGARSYARPQMASGDRVLATLMFVDIVDSTATLARVGDAKWRDLLGEHNAAVHIELDRHRGNRPVASRITSLAEGGELSCPPRPASWWRDRACASPRAGGTS